MGTYVHKPKSLIHSKRGETHASRTLEKKEGFAIKSSNRYYKKGGELKEEKIIPNRPESKPGPNKEQRGTNDMKRK